MKQVSNDYKNQIKEMGREIDSIITYYNHYKMITENGHYILTENGIKINTEQINSSSYVEIGAEDTYSSKVITHGSLLKTMMREFDFEVRQEMNIGSIVNYRFGVKVNGTYEYVDLGNFIVQEKEYNEDTSTYSYKAYDMMLKSMIPYKDTTTYPAPLIRLLKDILRYCDIPTNLYGTPGYDFPNQDRICDSNPFEGMDITCRDALDMITEVTGCSSFIKNDKFVIEGPTEAVTINLLDTIKQPITKNGVTFTPNEDGSIKVEGTSTGGINTNIVNSENPPIINVGDYTRSVKTIGTIVKNNNYVFLTGRDSNSNNIMGDMNINENSIMTKKTIIEEEHTMSGIGIFVSGAGVEFNCTLYIQLEKNANATPWQQYGSITLQADSFKNTNVKFNKLYGPINSILFSRNEDLDVIEIKDEASIEQYGVTQIKIKDNPLLEGNDRGDYFEEMFGVLNGLTYYVNELSSIGITYLEYMDLFKVQIENNEYQCLLLNDEINVEQGLEENIFSEEIEETEKEYKTSVLSDKEQKWANINIKKDVAEISLEVGEKVGKGEVISSINLSPESATIQAGKVNLNGYVTVTDLSTGGRTTINGSNITTGAINANLITTGSINASLITTGNLSANRISSGQITMKGYSQGHPFINLGDLTHDRYPYGIEIWDNCILLTDYRDGGVSYIRTSNGDGYAELSGASCNAFAFNNLSLEEKKKNFTKFENALDILKDIEIYKYNYKFEDNSDKKHIGFVIGDNYKYRREITDKKNENVDLYSFISLCCKAIQEQQKEIEELKKKVK